MRKIGCTVCNKVMPEDEVTSTCVTLYFPKKISTDPNGIAVPVTINADFCSAECLEEFFQGAVGELREKFKTWSSVMGHGRRLKP